jgi:hypothetical protein
MNTPPSDIDSSPRPWWMTLMAGGCLLTVLVIIPRDLFFETTREVEVWGGFEITGLAAMVTAPLHWLFFATCSWGFWKQRPWIVPVAAGYAFYAGVSHIVWSETSEHGRGWVIGVAQAAAISSVGVLLLRAGRSTSSDS